MSTNFWLWRVLLYAKKKQNSMWKYTTTGLCDAAQPHRWYNSLLVNNYYIFDTWLDFYLESYAVLLISWPLCIFRLWQFLLHKQICNSFYLNFCLSFLFICETVEWKSWLDEQILHKMPCNDVKVQVKRWPSFRKWHKMDRYGGLFWYWQASGQILKTKKCPRVMNQDYSCLYCITKDMKKVMLNFFI